MHTFKATGKLYLIPTTLGNTPPLDVLPHTVKQIIEQIDEYIVENDKTARAFIKSITPEKSQPNLILHTLNKYTESSDIPGFLNACMNGKSIGILSEAGAPGIADPGAEVVAAAHRRGIQVVPLVGPSSILMAMMGSGLNGQNFAFNGYLPIDKQERRKEIKRLERISAELNQAQSFIETPYRNNKMLEELSKTLNDQTQLCVACDISLPTEYIITKSISEWGSNLPDLHKRPAIFIIQKIG
ncbi:SAM-dependent methyltransferase [Flavimarina sp. Hel_I_48]|uniref:SAM-dependent methyltransferase n=1 Tax=Flavimarina sp. Hel_I_48 TaxID=1392488 RepID=UPI0004DF325A|nr:SAM-dependent methyltransferase [Flavimarina sp. Hel_I_48]